MRIAFYTHYFYPEVGAPSARVHELSREWLCSGHKVDVVTCLPNHPSGKIYPGYQSQAYLCEKVSGIRVHRNWTYMTPNNAFLKKTLGHASFLPSSMLLSSYKLKNPHVVIGTSPTFFAAMAADFTGFLKRVPFVMDVRDLWPAVFIDLGVVRNQRFIRLLELWELWLYRRAKRVVTVTQAFRKNLVERGVPEKKVHFVPNGADIQYWSQPTESRRLRRELNLQGCFVVLYLGAHGISHALDQVLQVAESLKKDPKIRFLFIGDGAEKMRLKGTAQEKRLPNVVFLDPVGKDKVREFYNLADLCLVPLRDIPLFEKFLPSKMFEIMAASRPVLGSVRGEAAEILRASGAAELVTPEDPSAMAGAIKRLRNDERRRRAMGISGYKFVSQNYSRKDLASRYLEVLQEAIDEG